MREESGKYDDLRRPRDVKTVTVGGLHIGGEHPVSVQSMTNTDTSDIEATLAQIEELVRAGCELVRLAVPDKEAAEALEKIVSSVEVPLMADIHFNHRLALMAVEAGIDGLRINPGNIGGRGRVREVVRACAESGVPIRIGVNSGSLEEDLAESFAGPTPEALLASAERHIAYLEELDFADIIVSLKSTDVRDTIRANRLFARKYPYPLHVGITEAGAGSRGEIKSAAGLGAMLAQGLGDTVRVSLTGSPIQEVKTAYHILRSLGLRKKGPEIISCPTCGRTEIDIEAIAAEVSESLEDCRGEFTVAIMGCAVNGPGEASHADVGLAGGRECGLIFREGEVVKKAAEEELISALLQEIKKMECDQL